MSGGYFDYFQYRINDAVHDIEEKIKLNNKTILERWYEMDDDVKSSLYDYEKPWTPAQHPYWVDDEASEAADKALGITTHDTYSGSVGKLSKAKRDKWNKIRCETLQRLLDEHNNSPVGPHYSEKTIERIKSMIPTLKKARIFLDGIDWLFSGDDGEDSFIRGVEKELKKEGLNDV